MGRSQGTHSGLGVLLDRLADLETRHKERNFDDLRDRVLSQEERAWPVFVEKYSRFVYTVALKLVAGAGDVEEAAAVIYERTFEKLRADRYRVLRNFAGRSRFTTYLYRIVQSERKEHFRMERAATEDASKQDVAAPPLADPVLRSEAIVHTVRAAIRGLDTRQRFVLCCRFRDGLKLRELASRCGFRDTNEAARAVYAALRKLDPVAVLNRNRDLGTAEKTEIEQALHRQLLRLEAAGETEN